MLRDIPSKDRGIPRHKSTYRFSKRNNAINWKGVETDRVEQHPVLVKQISKRGEVSYKIQE
jgi:hypothetical protein